jgi:hypothetical protein
VEGNDGTWIAIGLLDALKAVLSRAVQCVRDGTHIAFMVELRGAAAKWQTEELLSLRDDDKDTAPLLRVQTAARNASAAVGGLRAAARRAPRVIGQAVERRIAVSLLDGAGGGELRLACGQDTPLESVSRVTRFILPLMWPLALGERGFAKALLESVTCGHSPPLTGHVLGQLTGAEPKCLVALGIARWIASYTSTSEQDLLIAALACAVSSTRKLIDANDIRPHARLRGGGYNALVEGFLRTPLFRAFAIAAFCRGGLAAAVSELAPRVAEIGPPEVDPLVMVAAKLFARMPEQVRVFLAPLGVSAQTQLQNWRC